MPEKKEMCKITMVTDDDTGMYSVGEIDGLFSGDILRDYLKQHGENGKNALISHLGYLQHSVFSMWFALQNECGNANSCIKNPGE